MAAAVPAVEAARQCRVEAVPPDLIKPLLALVEFKQTLGLEELSPETFAEYYSATEAYVNYHAGERLLRASYCRAFVLTIGSPKFCSIIHLEPIAAFLRVYAVAASLERNTSDTVL